MAQPRPVTHEEAQRRSRHAQAAGYVPKFACRPSSRHQWRRSHNPGSANPVLSSLSQPDVSVFVCARCGYATNRPSKAGKYKRGR